MGKNIRKIALFFASAVVFLFASCNNLVGTVSGLGLNGDGGSLLVSVNNIDDYARLLAPVKDDSGNEVYNDIGSSGEILGYRISGESLTGLQFGPYTLDKAAVEGGTAKLTKVEKDDWTFTLYAINAARSDTEDTEHAGCYGDVTTAKTLLKGTAICKISSAGTTALAFTLSTYSVETEGSYDLKIKYTGSGWKTGYSFTYGLYNRTTGAVVKIKTANSSTTATADENAIATAYVDGSEVSNAGFAASDTAIAPGSYLFGVSILDKDSKELTFASDVIRIEPGRVTNQTFVIGDIIPTAPNAPVDLRAQRIIGTEDDEFYNVRFTWTDNSTNENSFKLVLRSFADTATDWTAITGASEDSDIDGGSTDYTIFDFDTLLAATTGSIRYVAGSLYAGSTEVVLKIPTGKLYDAQIIAVNKIGYSDGCVRVAPATANPTDGTYNAYGTGSTVSETVSKIVAAGKEYYSYGVASASSFERINLTKISYILNGGALTLSGTDYTGKIYVEYIPYKLQTDASAEGGKYIPLLNIDGSTNVLKKGTVNFTKWISYNSSNAVIDDIKYNVNSYKNITVRAVYGVTTGDITISAPDIESQPVLDAGRVTACSGTSATTASTTPSVKNAAVTVTRGSTTATYITVTVKAAESDQTVFARYILYVGGQELQEIIGDSGSFANFKVSDELMTLGAATQIMVRGITANGGEASTTFTITWNN